jgi:hypothetical protein
MTEELLRDLYSSIFDSPESTIGNLPANMDKKLVALVFKSSNKGLTLLINKKTKEIVGLFEGGTLYFQHETDDIIKVYQYPNFDIKSSRNIALFNEDGDFLSKGYNFIDIMLERKNQIKSKYQKYLGAGTDDVVVAKVAYNDWYFVFSNGMIIPEEKVWKQ